MCESSKTTCMSDGFYHIKIVDDDKYFLYTHTNVDTECVQCIMYMVLSNNINISLTNSAKSWIDIFQFEMELETSISLVVAFLITWIEFYIISANIYIRPVNTSSKGL